MSQSNVERILGALITDEALRRRFAEDRVATLRHLAETGLELNACERNALAGLDAAQLERFADLIDARLQKSDLKGGLHDPGTGPRPEGPGGDLR